MTSVAALTELTPAQRLELLKMARARDLVGGRAELPPIGPAAREGRPPLSFAQERLWFIDRLEPGSAVYNISVAWRLEGALDEAALERALGEIVRRHEALRTVFAEVEGAPVQVIAPFDGFALPVEDLSGLDEAEREAAVRRRAGEDAARPFDLSAGPLFRAALLRLGAEDHALLLSVHHIVGDGWSLGVLYRELSALYEAYREGGESPLPELPVQYADYAAWQREHLRDGVLEGHLSYWRKRLEGAPELLELPTDHPRPAVQTFRGAHERIELPLELLERLQALGRSEGATLYMVLLAAFQVLLGKYGGSEDVVVGSPVAGRTRKEVEELIGVFVNTLVLRTGLSGDPGFREVLRRTKETVLGAYEHQVVPFERLVAELRPERSLSHTPLFQVMFALQNAVERGIALPGVEVSEAGADLESAKFDLSLMPRATAQGLRVGLTYGTDLFERGTIVRMLGHLARVLEQVAADADVRLSRLELLDEVERALVLEAWNDTAAEVPADRCIHELFEAQAARTPDAVALRFEDASLTYAELNARANRLAHHLVRLGVGPEVRVGICFERSLEMVVSLLAVLKAGGAYVPLDPGLPAERLAYMLDDSAVPLVLAQAALRGAVPAREGVGVLAVDALAERLAAEPSENPAVGAGPDSLAYVIYTSGSTGRPKGVMNQHRGVVNRLAWMQAHFRLGAEDVVLQKTPFGFDVSVWEFFWPLQQGARLVMARPDGHRDPVYLRDTIEREGVTTLHFVPSMLQPFVETVEPGRCASLRDVVCSGEALPPALVRRFHDRFAGPVVLTNLYGPTEAAVDVSCWTCPRDEASGVVPIGRPVWNTALYVLDAALRPVPVGVPGELYIGGVQVARGYLGRAALTAERFVPDPYSAEGGARLYRTGDRARWRADGAIEYLGRLDFQVKVRGFRIELGEIEAALRQAPGVVDCAVVAREDEAGDRRLVAYVVGEAEAEALRERLRQTLPEYMVPSAFVFLDALPLSPNGKLDRKALPVPELGAGADRYVAPRTPVEEVLAGIWAEVLKADRVGVEESFFDLGGHSLLGTRVLSRVRELLGVELPLRSLFEGPTVARLAGRVEEMRRAGVPVLPPVVPVERTGALPLSFAQERLWFIDRLEPESAVYNVPVARRLAGALDEAALERALSEIVRRHEALRTVFAEVDGSPVQVVAPFGGFSLPVEDLSALGEAEREAAVRRRAREEARRAFDLSAGPLFRASLLRLGAEDHVLLLSMHHIVSDGWSMGVLFREMSALYAAYREGGESPLPGLAVQYADYAVWQREQLAGEVLERQLGYWRERLADAPALLELPTDRPRPAVQSHRGAREWIELPGELLERLRALGRSEGATLYMTLLGAFQVLLSKYAGNEDVVVGSPVAGRARGEVEGLIGFFVNTLVLRTDLSGDPSFREVLRRVREATLGAHEHQEVPFEKLVAELQPERSLSHSPLFQVAFALQDRDQPADSLAGLEVGVVEAELATTKFDLALSFVARPRGLRGVLTYSTDLFEQGTIDRMLGHLERVLEQVALNAEVRLSGLELFGAEEREQVLGKWNGTERGASDPPAHALFAQWARRAPEAVALLDGRAAVTYGVLDRRAAALARRLRDLGVGPETPVGLCMERTPDLLVGVLGIWKAGGAYVPLDPAYPAERLGWIIGDAALPVVVATEGTAGVLPEHGATLVRVDRLPETAEEAAPEVPVADASLAYVIHTSGSTGRPKGVLVQHGSLSNLLAATREAFGVGAGDVMPALASYAFDIWLFEALLPLTSGGAVRLVDRERVLDVPALVEEIADATLVHAVPALMRQLVHVERETPRLARLRGAFVGGDRVPADLLAEMRETLSGAESHVLYGPTEGTILASTHLVPRDGDLYGHPIGRPLGNVRLYVCDALGSPQPAGVPGELVIGGAGVARGYLGRAGLTAEQFVPDPFSAEGGARLYRTGDRARWRTDGSLEYLGRLDDQVKIRGFRIEPGEIESVLSAHAEVREARVIVWDDAPGEKRLVAYVVGGAEAEALRAHARRSLPEYMLPSAFVFLDALPLTPNGKLDRKALPAPELASAEERYVAPRTAAEEVLAGVWAEVLKVGRVGVEESFFELGGHSLLVTRVVSRVRELFGVELPLRSLFEGPTVAELAVRVEEMRRADQPVLPPVAPVERTGALPLSFAQERLWFVDRLEPGGATYNIPVARRLAGALDVGALERALGEIVRRHESLRTVFAEVDGSPVQVIAPFGGFSLPVEELSDLSEADREAAVRRRAGEEARRAFDLSAGPLFRAALLRLDAEDHVLLLSMHHIVSDGWSMGVLFRELSALYAAYREGGESPLPELAVQYADYAVWQREQLAGEVLDRQLAYWRDRLAGAPELLELPADHPRPAVRTYRGATVPVELSLELLERLQRLGGSESATLYMVLLGAFQVLLSKYAGSEDVVVGSPIAGRTRGEVEALIGFFVNTLVLRTDLSGDPSFRETLRRVREATLGAYAHQELPFERLVAELRPERSLNHSPLFQVVFALQNAEGPGDVLPGLEVSGVEAEHASAKLDLSLMLTATPRGLRGGLNYSTDLFERDTVERMLGHFARVLEQVAADADARLSRLELLGEAERARVLEAWNRTEAEYPADRCVHELFEAQVARTPDAVAVDFEGETLSYRALNERANRLARHLVRLGVGPEVRVGICLERGPGMVVSVLAVLKAGGAYVPLDPAYPAERLAFVMADAAVPVLVTRESLRATLSAGEGVAVVSVDGDANRIAAESAENPERAVSPGHLAYVIHTSGSTGTPKGVMVPHRGVANLAYLQSPRFGIGATSRVLQFASFSFDAAAAELFDTLLTGATLVMAPREALLPGPGLLETLRSGRVTVATLPPSVLAVLPPDGLPELRTVISAGEAVDAATVERWSGGRVFVNGYGPTETTVCATTAACEADGRAPAIGRPLENMRAYVLDAAGRPVPAGVPGELYMGGVGVVRGYLGRPGLTAEKFVPDPFGGEPGARLYRTGDRVRWRPEGVLEYLGRLDEQVKVRGFRVEPGEIEAALRRYAGVRECVVVAREDASGGARLVGYIAGEADLDALRAHLRRSLPDYMVPSAFVFLDVLPLTPNGKVDRHALPAPEPGSAEERYVAPRTPVEEVLAGIWAEVLKVGRVGVEESFFELGGHSLLATRVVSRIRELFGVELPLRVLFEGPTVAGLAKAVEETRRAELPVLPPVVPVERTGAPPLSFAQERLWFIDRLEPGSTTYNISAAWRLGGALDAAALERALGEVVRRHEALRTTFAEVDGSPVQVIAPFDAFALPVEDLSALDEAEREAAVRRRAGEEAARPFDLSAGPLFRAALLRLGAEDHVLLLSVHHIVSDGWSMGVLFRELSALYESYREGGESPLPELAVQYADYAVWQREQLAGEVLDSQLAYWKERLSGAPELLELPTDHPRPAVQSDRGAHEPVELSGELVERLRALGRSEGATLYMVLLGAFQVLLSKYGGSEDVVVGSPIAGRTRGEVGELIGFFVNTLVLRTDLSGDPSFREVLRRVRETTLGAYEHQEVPFERLVEELRPERSFSHSPLFQVLFALQNAGEGEPRLDGVEMRALKTGEAAAKFDLSFVLGERDGAVSGVVAYRAELWEAATVRRMLGYFRAVLEALAGAPDRHLSSFELPAGEERRLLLDEWSRSGAAPEPPARCVHELFAEQAERTPGAVALVFGDETLTYAELHRRSDALARRLAACGVGPEARAGICVERGPEMVVGLLGILKAGGAYLPLDPQYPAERLAYMLADAGATLLLTQERLRDRLPAFGGEVVLLDGDGDDAGADGSARASSLAPRAASPESLAYVIYTSGSTGLPKGTEVPHRAIPGFFRGADYARFDEGTVVLQHSSVSWDAMTLELWPALLSGGTCVLYPGETSEPGLLGEQVRAHGVNTLWLTAAYFNLIVDTAPEILRGVEQVMAGGEAVSAPHARRALELNPRLRLVNGYGPSETTVFATCHPISRSFDAPAVPIGRPVGDRRVYLLDRHFGAVPLGAAGEVCIGGPGVARGYLGRPGLTAERFVPDPFGEPGARLYRSGDRARWSAEGELEFVGRVDFQVKIRGFRVEPGEVEAVLRASPGVREAAVVVREDEPGDRRLVAYVAGEVAADELREHLRGRLPEHMLPAALVFLEALPLTANGKLDRKALPAPEYGGAEDEYVAPRTPVEEVLAGIWAEVLGVGRVGVEDGFFDLGGHSLLATRVVSRLREVFGVELPLRSLFEGPTVAELARAVEDERRRELTVLPPVVPVGRAGALPLSFAQERLWFIDRLEPGSATYNIPAALRLTGALDERALERALSEIVRRHEALRTVFSEVDGSPVQVVTPFGGFSLPVEELSGSSEADREAAVRRRAGEEAARPFDLAAGPLFRAALLRLGPEDHALLLSMHHIVSDGWSMGVLFRELSALYEAYRDGGESPLPELAVQYADYAVWQREQLEGEVLDRRLAYWRERLADAPALLELPTDHPRPPVQTYRGATVPVELSPELLERLQRLGRSEGATLYMVLLGAFQVLLSKYAGSEDVVVGSPIAGRTRREVEGLIGFFVNTLVLRTGLSGDPSFREVLGRVREATLGAYEHQEVPFEKLVAELRPERSLSHAPLFQVMLALQDAGGGGVALPGLSVSGAGGAMESAKFDLSLTLAATPQGLRGGLNYGTDLFERGTVERMLGHLERVLEQVAADADARLSRLELLGRAERARVLEEWNRTGAEYPADRCIHALFEAQAARTPGAVALRFEEESLTYAELNARANQLAHHLRRHGVGPEVRVGICMERSLEMVAGILGVLKAGGAYVPLDPGYPAERLAYVLDDSAVPLVLAQAALREAVPAREGVKVLAVDALAERLSAEPSENPAGVAVDPSNLAYVIYTSGSTGRPKGVMNQHRGVVNRLWWMQAEYGLGADDVVLQKTPFSFDVSVWEFFWPLQQGATLVMARPDGHRDPPYLQEVIERRGVTTVHFVPSMLQQFVETAEAARCASLRRVVCSGEALPPALVARFHERLPASAALHNLYGPTEAAVDVSYWACAREDAAGVVPIGRPVWNTRLYVLDDALRPVPVGVPGELYIGGVQVARGYQGRPAMTAERFVPDPYSAEGGARLYRTGDRARWRPDSAIEYLGRLDHQVKVRGFRIELGEIESVLLDHPAVREAVVLTRGEGEATRLVAWIVAAGEVAAEELRAHLRARLPAHMVPSAFARLDALPLTRNGKLDRRALPEPEAGGLAGTHFVAPGTPTEEVLAALWARLLGAGRVGATDDFFALGGHSLLATRVASRVRELFGVELPIRAVFEHSGLGALAAEVDRLRRGGAGVEAPPLVPVSRDGDLPLSLAQERLWFVDRMEPGSATYHMPRFVRMEGALDPDALRRALDELARRHESLRTSFPLVDGAPVQRVAPPAPAEVVFHDLSALRDDERDDEAARLVREQARLPFWLETGPLFRADLVKLGEDDHLLLATLHHAIADGWSLDLLWHELAALYGAFSRGEASPLPEPRIQYGDFSVWQRAWLQGEVLERQLAFWRRALEGAPPLLALPTDRPRPEVQTHSGALERALLPRETADAVLALARQEGATLFMVLLAALDLVFSRQSGQEDVVVGTPVAGRTRAETDRVVGLFLNSLALRVSLAGDPGFRELLRRVRETTLDAYAHQDVPFEAVLEEIQPERSRDRTPVFQVMLNLANFAGAAEATAAADAPSGFDGLRVRGVDPGVGVLGAKFDLTLYVGERPDGIGLTLVYNPDLFDAGRMSALLAQLVAVLEQALEDPGLPLSRFVLADGRAPGAGRELRTAAGLPAGVGEPGEVWERRDGSWAATGERGRYLPDGSIAALSSTPEPEPETPEAPAPEAGGAMTETEREMLAIWREVLDEEVELHDDFFDLGGHSLLGVRLLALVKKRLGRTLALPVLFAAATPAALAAEVDDTGEGRGFAHLVLMGGEEGALPPLFIVHPAGGTVFQYAALAGHLGPGRPVYAIQAAGVTDGAEPLRTVDLMASRYLEEVLRLQPQGPYYLAGWSAGGVIALEMAHRLRAAGHEVALAGILDSSPPSAEKPVPDPVHLYRRLAAGLSSAEPAELDALEEEIRVLPIDDRLPYLARWLGAHGAESRVQELDGLKPVVEVFRANVVATRRHPLAPYPGRVTLFCAELGRGKGWEAIGLPELWKPYVTGELEVVIVPGTHISMINEPHVGSVAAAIQDALARC